MVLKKVLAIAVVLATLWVSGSALAQDADEEEGDPELLDEDDGLTDEPSTDDIIYCRWYGWPPTPYCVI